MIRRALRRIRPVAGKRQAELGYWRRRRESEGELGHAHYVHLFTEHFGLDPGHYAGKRVLDVGCGPRGSLEWAEQAAERVGADPLAEDYRALGTGRHAMRYVAAPAEALPFEDGRFDVVTCFNALDHVEDPDRALDELARVVAPGGSLLLVVEVGHEPTVNEPHTLGWDVADRLVPPLTIVSRRHDPGGAGTGYAGLFGPAPPQEGPPPPSGWLSVRLDRS